MVRVIVTIVISPIMATGETAAAIIVLRNLALRVAVTNWNLVLAAMLVEEMVVRTMYSTAVIQVTVMEEMTE